MTDDPTDEQRPAAAPARRRRRTAHRTGPVVCLALGAAAVLVALPSLLV